MNSFGLSSEGKCPPSSCSAWLMLVLEATIYLSADLDKTLDYHTELYRIWIQKTFRMANSEEYHNDEHNSNPCMIYSQKRIVQNTSSLLSNLIAHLSKRLCLLDP
jgi:hypothetical protein